MICGRNADAKCCGLLFRVNLQHQIHHFAVVKLARACGVAAFAVELSIKLRSRRWQPEQGSGKSVVADDEVFTARVRVSVTYTTA
jgi:hypothetical protein